MHRVGYLESNEIHCFVPGLSGVRLLQLLQAKTADCFWILSKPVPFHCAWLLLQVSRPATEWLGCGPLCSAHTYVFLCIDYFIPGTTLRSRHDISPFTRTTLWLPEGTGSRNLTQDCLKVHLSSLPLMVSCLFWLGIVFPDGDGSSNFTLPLPQLCISITVL